MIRRLLGPVYHSSVVVVAYLSQQDQKTTGTSVLQFCGSGCISLVTGSEDYWAQCTSSVVVVVYLSQQDQKKEGRKCFI